MKTPRPSPDSSVPTPVPPAVVPAGAGHASIAPARSKPAAPDAHRDRIAARAHALWEEEGRPDGHDLRHWFAAEQELRGGDEPADEPGPSAPQPRPRSSPEQPPERPAPSPSPSQPRKQ